jgi:hypothetical protein
MVDEERDNCARCWTHKMAGNHILMADGALTMRVEAVDTEAGTVTCRALNTATVGADGSNAASSASTPHRRHQPHPTWLLSHRPSSQLDACALAAGRSAVWFPLLRLSGATRAMRRWASVRTATCPASNWICPS